MGQPMGQPLEPVPYLSRGRPRRYTDVLECEILRILAEHDGPVGSGTLQIALRRRGLRLSAPTVGRKLRELEVDGAVVKVGVRGRVLTPAGRDRFTELERELRLASSSEALNQLITRGSKQEILELLEARRILEREIIRLAVRHATPKDVERLQRILHSQEERVARGELAVAEDVRFHDALAGIGGNRVLRSLLSVLRHQGQYSYIITYIRRRVGGQLAVDHVEILNALRARDVHRAQRAVDDHLRRLMRDVERYWQVARVATRRRGRLARETVRAGGGGRG